MSARTDFAVLGTQQVAQRMGAVLPEAFRPARTVNGRTRTCRYLEIGCAYQSQRRADDMSSNELHLQAALLEPRTAKPLSTLLSIAGAAWRWL